MYPTQEIVYEIGLSISTQRFENNVTGKEGNNYGKGKHSTKRRWGVER